MLLWLNGSDNSKDSPNENYGARDDGALHARRRPRLHRERRPRAGARAHRLPQRLEPEQRSGRTSATTPRTTIRREDDLPSRGHFTWKDSCRLCVTPPGRTRRSSSRSSGATSSRCRRTTRRSARSSGSTSRRVRDPARRRGDPHAPGALRRAAAGEVAGRLQRRASPPDPARDRHDRLDLARLDGRPAALLPAERRRLGRHALARHGDLARPLVDRPVRARPRTRSTPDTPTSPYDAKKLLDRRLPVLARAAARHATRGTRSTRSRTARSTTPRAPTGRREQYPAMVQNALRQLIAVSPELQAA